MSAWYIFTTFGFYPVNPASGDYMIGSPLFAKMSLRLANGEIFSVTAETTPLRTFISCAAPRFHIGAIIECGGSFAGGFPLGTEVFGGCG
jgi:hypothetical protein